MKDRLISALVDACREVKCCKVEFCEKHHKECIDKLINCLLADAEGETVKNCHRLKWIPVTERLPEPGKIVMVYDKDHGMWTSHRLYTHLQEKPFVIEYSGDWRITHWMPLPEAPKEGE